ncbi:branched-chain-amino-acid aminotransferase [Diaporthe helianthi]|uniref:Branched-chain-amino-acid aminotransferase n=1 Tax=Diaporthe helianthi TaxID=158607 RepID=A0A2P5HX29_DIAHE|nr:branched-chain-amino-acid aminotransferase [Diaporthe helianthi]
MARLLGATTPRAISASVRTRPRFQHHHARTVGTAASQGLGLEPDVLSEYPGLDASKLTIAKNKNPKQLLRKEDLIFGRDFTDHMLTAEWTAATGWAAPAIIPFQKICLEPQTTVFHYGIECFEGQKAYRARDGSLRLFRADMNAARLNKSTARLALPQVDPEQLQKLIRSLVALEDRFIPSERGYSLYLRTNVIGTQPSLGIGPSLSALLFCIACPVGPYYPTGFKAVKLEATGESVRAWPGGVGDKKLGANYGPCILPQLMAQKRGFQQNLWLFGAEEQVTEVGAMNFFAVLRDAKGRRELVTPPLDGTILEGITRNSVLALARERLVPEGWEVSERVCTMAELASAAADGRLEEAFGVGTAAVVSPIRSIDWKGITVNCGLDADQEAGDTAIRLKNWIEEIQYGEVDHPWSTPV